MRVATPRDPPAVVLASRSPRRQEALGALGVAFEVIVSDAEARLGPLSAGADPVPIATAKAEDVAPRRPGATTLAGDTIVDLQGVALGKPEGPPDAVDMLRRLRGREHAVRSAVAVAGAGKLTSCEVAAPLRMRHYPDGEIDAYVATGEPLDCAGAYDVHRLGGALVAAVWGCFSAVVGLPIVAAVRLLRDAGVDVPRDPVRTCSLLYGRECLAAREETASRCQPARLTGREISARPGGLPQ